MTRVAAIDCGTNSIRLLIADVTDGRLTDVVRTMTVVRLGQGVDQTGEFAADARAQYERSDHAPAGERGCHADEVIAARLRELDESVPLQFQNYR